jgi:hypothetical protein
MRCLIHPQLSYTVLSAPPLTSNMPASHFTYMHTQPHRHHSWNVHVLVL